MERQIGRKYIKYIRERQNDEMQALILGEQVLQDGKENEEKVQGNEKMKNEVGDQGQT